MGYRLQMSAEIRDWLTELRDSDPSTAVLAAQAVAALADAGDRLGPPLVIAVASRLAPSLSGGHPGTPGRPGSELEHGPNAGLRALNLDITDAVAIARQVEDDVAQLLQAALQHRHGLLEIDDMDAVTIHEDEWLHLGIPAPGLVPEVDACFKKLLH